MYKQGLEKGISLKRSTEPSLAEIVGSDNSNYHSMLVLNTSTMSEQKMYEVQPGTGKYAVLTEVKTF